MGTGGLFPGGKAWSGVTLTTHPHLVPRSRMSRDCISSSLWCLHDVLGQFYLFDTYFEACFGGLSFLILFTTALFSECRPPYLLFLHYYLHHAFSRSFMWIPADHCNCICPVSLITTLFQLKKLHNIKWGWRKRFLQLLWPVFQGITPRFVCSDWGKHKKC
jgi:hypothetical protein